jgi:hypothetical protein
LLAVLAARLIEVQVVVLVVFLLRQHKHLLQILLSLL